MSMSRLLPALLLLGGGGIAVKGGGDVGKQVVDTVKTVMTRYELSEAARHLELDMTLGNQPPRSTAQLAKWLGDNHRGRFARDPAIDLWQNDYLYQPAGGGGFGLVSIGANGIRDRCVNTNPDADRRRLRRAVQRQQETNGADDAAPESILDDDICVWLGGNQRGSKRGSGALNGRRMNRDSPFRQIRHDK